MSYIFLDIDGTLYSPKTNAVPTSAMTAITEAKANGHKLFVCTGRSLSAARLFLNLDVDGFVFSAGAVVYAQGKRIYDKSMSLAEINNLIQIAKKHNLGYCLEGNAGAYYDKNAYRHVYDYFGDSARDEEEGNVIMKNNCYYPLEYRDESDRVAKMCFYADTADDMEKMKKDLPNEFQCLMTPNHDDKNSYCGEISYRTETKSTAAKLVCETYGATLKDAIGVGDSSNDYEMIRDCGIGIAMGNASADAKEVADYITTEILDDGIYNAFKHYGII